jgi:hypothetical protein
MKKPLYYYHWLIEKPEKAFANQNIFFSMSLCYNNTFFVSKTKLNIKYIIKLIKPINEKLRHKKLADIVEDQLSKKSRIFIPRSIYELLIVELKYLINV